MIPRPVMKVCQFVFVCTMLSDSFTWRCCDLGKTAEYRMRLWPSWCARFESVVDCLGVEHRDDLCALPARWQLWQSLLRPHVRPRLLRRSERGCLDDQCVFVCVRHGHFYESLVAWSLPKQSVRRSVILVFPPEAHQGRAGREQAL